MAARRRAGRATSRELARTRRDIARSVAAEVEKDINKRIARSVQEFAVASMNSLAQKGPAWSGEFSASWGFAPAGRTPRTPGTSGSVYQYGKKDVPVRDVERFLKDGVTRFEISNTAEYADQATDQAEGMFFSRDKQRYPIKEPVESGYKRPDDLHMRYQFGRSVPEDKKPNAFITAEADWFETYTRGGGLQKDLERGVSIGLRG